jgi:hypothetical protein
VYHTFINWINFAETADKHFTMSTSIQMFRFRKEYIADAVVWIIYCFRICNEIEMIVTWAILRNWVAAQNVFDFIYEILK